MEDAIIMDKRTFKLLASETRISILKLLKKRDYNLSEIALKLSLSKSTVKEHVDLLLKADVITVIDRGKWKYYSLTGYGSKLINDKDDGYNIRRVVIILAMLMIGFMFVFMMVDSFVLNSSEDEQLGVLSTSEPIESNYVPLYSSLPDSDATSSQGSVPKEAEGFNVNTTNGSISPNNSTSSD